MHQNGFEVDHRAVTKRIYPSDWNLYAFNCRVWSNLNRKIFE
jgi:hypothetical protein